MIFHHLKNPISHKKVKTSLNRVKKNLSKDFESTFPDWLSNGFTKRWTCFGDVNRWRNWWRWSQVWLNPAYTAYEWSIPFCHFPISTCRTKMIFTSVFWNWIWNNICCIMITCMTAWWRVICISVTFFWKSKIKTF